ncbi:UvrD-helicase domain-containing protein [Castellaniella sp.]|uniref:UvrD-helicase domain-containing protein n=1 Tax=Castellaniella sp. TaxID=1955812 RepID=UPI00355E9C8B
MRILEYIDLDTRGVGKAYRKVCQAIGAGDFQAAQVKKLSGINRGKFYRARLDAADRLLFSLLRHGDEVCALMLEVIRNHDYDSSRFLRGARVDEAKIPDFDPQSASTDAEPLRYLHPTRSVMHVLDKPISFDDTQEAIFRMPAPLVVVGSAGSGKTVLTLEKLKQAEGDVLYVTHSAYLAQSARDLYQAHGFTHDRQEATFLSFRDLVESIRVPQGREALWRDFTAWFERMRQAFRGLDPHQAFEEIRGVITASAQGPLTREGYRALGVRESIFTENQRDTVYDLFEKYRAWLQQAGLFDLNLIAWEWLARVTPRYDFVVIDEVQDMTPVQLALILKTLTKPGQFLLCGDSNQIVHPNFFSWSQVKNLFWRDPELASRQTLNVLNANFRNGHEATRVANQLLKLKQQRFGSIDRESNYLVDAVGGAPGTVHLMTDQPSVKKDLDRQISQSTQFAVLVMRDEDKAQARRHFRTPLLFSVREAKGLEYDNIILYRFVSDHRQEFSEVAHGIAPSDLEADTLDYRRARDKTDKSLQIYKFYVNALYVALTRALRNLYVIESDPGHPLFELLGLAEGAPVRVIARKASTEDWQKEARKLELQGKQEQAEAIREGILRQKTVPWPVFDQARTTELLVKVFRDRQPGNKPRQQAYEIAICHDLPLLAEKLESDAGYKAAGSFTEQRIALAHKSHANYFARTFKDILQQCDTYGVEHRLPMNLTPLMAAAAAGNVALAETLLERGADRDAVDHFGCNALHWAMRKAFQDESFAHGPFQALYGLLAPAAIDVNTGDRLVRIERHLAEYILFQTMWALYKTCFTDPLLCDYSAFDTEMILNAWAALPTGIVRDVQNRRAHVSNVLSRNEVARDYRYNRALFKRVRQGFYQFNPELSIRVRNGTEDSWVPVHQALNLPFINEFAQNVAWTNIDACLLQARMPARTDPIVFEHALAELRAELKARQAARIPPQPIQPQPIPSQPAPKSTERAPWGTPKARQQAIEELRQKIAERKMAAD